MPQNSILLYINLIIIRRNYTVIMMHTNSVTVSKTFTLDPEKDVEEVDRHRNLFHCLR